MKQILLGLCLVMLALDCSSDQQANLYPEDRATGYKEGDIRGAFVVIQKLSN